MDGSAPSQEATCMNQLICPIVFHALGRDIPQLRRHRIHHIPVQYAQYRQPELCPMRALQRSTQLPQLRSRLLHARIFRINTQYPHSSIIHRSAKHGALTLNMQSPPPIFRILPRKQVPYDLVPMMPRYRRLGNIPRNDQPGKQEHRTAVFARPVSNRLL